MNSKPKFNQFVGRNDEEIELLLKESKIKNTQRSTQAALKKFQSYLKLRKMPMENEIADEQLPRILTKFYTSTTGKLFKTGSLKVIRAGLNRHFKITRSIDIVADEPFRHANLVFEGVQVKAKKQGKGATVSTFHISDQDLTTLEKYFFIDHVTKPNPKRLQ